MADEEVGSAEEKAPVMIDEADRSGILQNMADDHTKSKAKLFMKEFKEKYGDIEGDEEKLIYEDKEKQKLLQQEKDKTCFPATYKDKVILLVYVVCILAAVALMIIYLVFITKLEAKIGCIVGVVVTTWIGVLVALVTIYNGANVRAQAEEVKEENNQYYDALNEMVNLKAAQFKSIKRLLNEYNSLDATQVKLQEQANKFSGLVQEFESLREDWPDIDEVFNNLQDTDHILTKLRNSNERAKLFDAFYEAERDGIPGLNEREFEIFYRRIPKRYQKKMQRLKMREYSEWDHNGDGNIDTLEFEKMIVMLLDDTNEEQS